jgi:hypothetical protein
VIRNIRGVIERFAAGVEASAVGTTSSNEGGMPPTRLQRSGSGQGLEELMSRPPTQPPPMSPMYIEHQHGAYGGHTNATETQLSSSPLSHSPRMTNTMPQNVPSHRRSVSSGTGPAMLARINTTTNYAPPYPSPRTRTAMAAAHQQHHQHAYPLYSQPGPPPALSQVLSSSLSDSSGFPSPMTMHGRTFSASSDGLFLGSSGTSGDAFAQPYFDPSVHGVQRSAAPPRTRSGELFTDYRNAPVNPSARRASVPASHFVGAGSVPNYLSSMAVTANAATAAAIAAAHTRKRSQSGPSCSVGPLLDQSIGSSPHSDHGDMTTSSTVATGDTSLVSPFFGSPGPVEESAMAATGKRSENAAIATHDQHSQPHVFPEVLVARAPSTTGIGVTIDPANVPTTFATITPAEAAANITATVPLIPVSALPNNISNAPISSPPHPTHISSPPHPTHISSPPHPTHISSPPHPTHRSPCMSVPEESQWEDDDLDLVDANDPELVELWEKQRREAEAMARNHMAEWERLMQELRDRRMAQRGEVAARAPTNA